MASEEWRARSEQGASKERVQAGKESELTISRSQLPVFEVEESTALVFLERVSDAQRLATREMKELAAASSSKGRGGKKRRGDDDFTNMRNEARSGYGGGSSGKGGGYHNQRGGGNAKKKRK